MLRVDRALRRGFLGWLLRRARPAATATAGHAFGYLERGSYRTACAFVLFSSLVELPLDAAVMPLFIHDPAERMLIHLLMLAASLSSIVYVLGDRWLVGAGRHLLDGEGLRLHIGARTHGSIPLEAIAACERLAEPEAAWLRRHGIEGRHALRVSPFALDKPNLVLSLKPGSQVHLTHLGVERNSLFSIFLYVDRPQDLQRCLSRPGDRLAERAHPRPAGAAAP